MSDITSDKKIENNFRYHAPKEGQAEKYDELRAAAKEYAYKIKNLTPESREQSTAITNLENCMFWANAAVARNPE